MAACASAIVSYSTRAYPCTQRYNYRDKTKLLNTHLDITRPPIKVQVQILDLSKVCKLVLQILFGRLLVNVGHKYDPSLDRWETINASGPGYLRLIDVAETYTSLPVYPTML